MPQGDNNIEAVIEITRHVLLHNPLYRSPYGVVGTSTYILAIARLLTSLPRTMVVRGGAYKWGR